MTKNIDAHILKEFKIGHLMGSGAYGHVWKVQSKLDGQRYALKKVFGAFRNGVDAQRTYRQVQILRQVNHKNIIKLVRVIKSVNKQDLYLVFELMEADLLSVVGSNILSIHHQKYLIFQLLTALSYLHELKLIHRDLKPSNLLLDSNCILKICDFGLVRSLNAVEPDNQILSEQVATKWYRAPELLLGSRSYSFPIDLWSVGCITAQLLIGKTLFSGGSTLEQLQKILEYSGEITQQDLESLDSPVAECLISQIHPKRRQFLDYFSLVDPLFYPLLKATLQFNPDKRLTARQCLQLDLFKEFQTQGKEIREYVDKRVSLSLDDNVRFKIKDYRSHIYDSLHKMENSQHSEVAQQKNKKYKSLTNINSQQMQSPSKAIKHKSPAYLIQKREASIKDSKTKVDLLRKIQNRSTKLISPKSKSLSKSKYGSPYKNRVEQLATVLKNKSHVLLARNTKNCVPSKLKKVGKLLKYDKGSKK